MAVILIALKQSLNKCYENDNLSDRLQWGDKRIVGQRNCILWANARLDARLHLFSCCHPNINVVMETSHQTGLNEGEEAKKKR